MRSTSAMPEWTPADHRRPARRGVARLAVRPPFGDVPGPFRRGPHRDTSLDDQPTRDQERGMRAFWWDGFWANIPETILVNYLGGSA